MKLNEVIIIVKRLYREYIKKYVSRLIVAIILSVIVALVNTSLSNFYLSLILVGLGWNFGFIGATSLLTKNHSSLEKGKIQGLNDFCIFGFVALASLTSGFLMNCSSSSTELGWQLINITATPFIALAMFSVLFLSIFNRPFKTR